MFESVDLTSYQNFREKVLRHFNAWKDNDAGFPRDNPDRIVINIYDYSTDGGEDEIEYQWDCGDVTRRVAPISEVLSADPTPYIVARAERRRAQEEARRNAEAARTRDADLRQLAALQAKYPDIRRPT